MKHIFGNDIYKDVQLLPEDSAGWNNSSNIFKELVKKTNPKTIIEVGTWKGGSVIKMAKAAKELQLECTIFCVDTWLGALEFWTSGYNTPDRNLMFKNGQPQIYQQFLSNMIHNNLTDMVLPVTLPSNTAYEVFKYYNITADLIYIDASHEYKDVLTDITNYTNLLNPGGVIFGDDFQPASWPGVVQAVTETYGDKFEVIENNFWVYEN